MEESKSKLHWIIMADIIDSSEKEGNQWYEEFKNLVQIINEKFKKRLISPLTITLGDEFQGIAKKLHDCTEILVAFEELSIAQNLTFKLRYVVKQGIIQTPINQQIAHGMVGSGLTEARQKLSELKKTSDRFYFYTNKPKLNTALNAAFVVFENLIDKWSSNSEKQMAYQFITLNDYKKVAEKTGVSRSQIWKKERSLNISSYFAIKNVINYLSK